MSTTLAGTIAAVTPGIVQVSAASYSENADYIFEVLTRKLGYSEAAACGIMANIRCESTFNPHAWNAGGGSYGLCQWTGGRYGRLQSWCRSNGYDYTTIDGQLAYLEYELQNHYRGVEDYLRSVDNTSDGAYDAGQYYCYHFEAPASRGSVSVYRGGLASSTFWEAYRPAEWYFEDGVWRYIKRDGTYHKSWLTIENKTYYLDENGNRISGWRTIDGNRYYFDKDGIMATGWVKIDGKDYYFGEDGPLIAGLVMDNDSWFMLDEAGNIQASEELARYASSWNEKNQSEALASAGDQSDATDSADSVETTASAETEDNAAAAESSEQPSLVASKITAPAEHKDNSQNIAGMGVVIAPETAALPSITPSVAAADEDTASAEDTAEETAPVESSVEETASLDNTAEEIASDDNTAEETLLIAETAPAEEEVSKAEEAETDSTEAAAETAEDTEKSQEAEEADTAKTADTSAEAEEDTQKEEESADTSEDTSETAETAETAVKAEEKAQKEEEKAETAETEETAAAAEEATTTEAVKAEESKEDKDETDQADSQGEEASLGAGIVQSESIESSEAASEEFAAANALRAAAEATNEKAEEGTSDGFFMIFDPASEDHQSDDSSTQAIASILPETEEAEEEEAEEEEAEEEEAEEEEAEETAATALTEEKSENADTAKTTQLAASAATVSADNVKITLSDEFSFLSSDNLEDLVKYLDEEELLQAVTKDGKDITDQVKAEYERIDPRGNAYKVIFTVDYHGKTNKLESVFYLTGDTR